MKLRWLALWIVLVLVLLSSVTPKGFIKNMASVNSDVGYDIVLVLGQSNAVGADATFDKYLDYSDPRILTFDSTGAYAGLIRLGADPLYHLIGANGVGPGMAFARRYVEDIPSNRRVLLVPAAYSGTPIYGADSNGVARSWNPLTPAVNLYEQAIYRAQLALKAAGPNSRIVAATWSQGENDVINHTSASQYQVGLEQIIDGLRDRLAIPNLPFIISGMLPETIASDPNTAAIDAVHRATPARKSYTAFVAGPVGRGIGDAYHYSASGARILGNSLEEIGYHAAISNTAGTVASNPPARPAPVNVYSSDSFQRQNRSGLGRSDGPGTYGWVSEELPASINNNTAVLSSAAANTNRISTIDDGATGGTVRATFATVGTGGLAFADTGSAGGGYVVCWSVSYAAWVVFIRNGSAYSNPAGGIVTKNFAPVSGSVLSATVSNGSIVVSIDGNTIYTFTNPVYNGTRWGLFNVEPNDPAAVFVNWSHTS